MERLLWELLEEEAPTIHGTCFSSSQNELKLATPGSYVRSAIESQRLGCTGHNSNNSTCGVANSDMFLVIFDVRSAIESNDLACTRRS